MAGIKHNIAAMTATSDADSAAMEAESAHEAAASDAADKATVLRSSIDAFTSCAQRQCAQLQAHVADAEQTRDVLTVRLQCEAGGDCKATKAALQARMLRCCPSLLLQHLLSCHRLRLFLSEALLEPGRLRWLLQHDWQEAICPPSQMSHQTSIDSLVRMPLCRLRGPSWKTHAKQRTRSVPSGSRLTPSCESTHSSKPRAGKQS